jgi:hypothetical protein
MSTFTEVREVVQAFVNLASRAGWTGSARVAPDGEGFVITVRVQKRVEQLSERELKRLARIARG